MVIKNGFNTYVPPVCLAALCCAALIYSGVLPRENRSPVISLFPMNAVSMITGLVRSNPVRTRDGSRYTMNLSVDSVGGSISGRRTAQRYGNFISEATGMIVVSVPAAAVEAYLPGRRFSDSRVGNTGSAVIETGRRLKMSGHITEKNGRTVFYADVVCGGAWNNAVSRVRGACRMHFRRMLYAWKDAGGLLFALIAGSREYTDGVLAEHFEQAGLSHILALSGMHLSFFSGLAAFAAVSAGKKKAELFSFAAVLLFVWFAGLTPSLLRALLCLFIMAVCRFCSLRVNSLHVLCFAFLLHCFIKPEDVHSAAFVLSYAASCGISVFTRPVLRICAAYMPRRIADSTAVSVAAQIFTLPVCACMFGVIPLAAVPASVCIAPLISLFMAVGLAGIIVCMFMPFLLQPLGVIISAVYNVIAGIVCIFAGIPRIFIDL